MAERPNLCKICSRFLKEICQLLKKLATQIFGMQNIKCSFSLEFSQLPVMPCYFCLLNWRTKWILQWHAVVSVCCDLRFPDPWASVFPVGNANCLFLSEKIALLLTKLWINLKRCMLRVSLGKALIKDCLGRIFLNMLI